MAGGLRTSTRRGRRGRRQMSEINVTPFVDVMLVLLIIFMVAAPLLTVGVPVDLPKTDAKSLPSDQEPISVTVTQQGAIYIGADPVAYDAILGALAAKAGDNMDRRIFIRADETADYGVVMKVMARVNAAGYRNLGLVTDPVQK